MKEETNINLKINSDACSNIIAEGIKSAVKWVAAMYFVGLLLLAIVIVAADKFGARDTTDGVVRSGMELHTDAMTGCQYLSIKGAGMIARLDGNGAQICGDKH